MGKRGLVRVEATKTDRVGSKVFGCRLRSVGDGRNTRVRIATGANASVLFPTAEEMANAERAAKEQERDDKEHECAAKEAALARISILEAELKSLRHPTGHRRRR